MKFHHNLQIICPILCAIIHTFSYAQVLSHIYALEHKHGCISWSLIDKTAIKADYFSHLLWFRISAGGNYLGAGHIFSKLCLKSLDPANL